MNLTDEESRIMPVAGGGFEQCYNAQAVVAASTASVCAATSSSRGPARPRLAGLAGVAATGGWVQKTEHRASNKQAARATDGLWDLMAAVLPAL
jgi:hypothetical protein